MSKQSKDLLSFLFFESAEADADESRIAENLQQLFEAAAEEEKGELQSKKTPLAKALSEFGIEDVDLCLDPEGFTFCTDNREKYEDVLTLLGTADAMHKLAEMGWVVTKPGDPAMTSEGPHYRVRFLEITTVDQNDREPKAGTYDTANREEVIKKAQKFASTPMDRDDDLNPVDQDTGKPDSLDKGTKRKGVGDPKDGAKAEKSIHDALVDGDVDKLLEMTTTGSMGTVDSPIMSQPFVGMVKKPKPYGHDGTKFKTPGQWTVKQPVVKKQIKRKVQSEALGAGAPQGPSEMSAEQFLESPGPESPYLTQPGDPNYDDIGSGKYDHMGMDERFPLHVQKAKEFLEAGDMFNAGMHARAAIEIGARGYMGTEPYKQAEEILWQSQQQQ